MSRRPRQPEDTKSKEGFLARWSRRKDRASSDQSPQPQEQAQPEPDDQKVEEPTKRDEDMPPVDTIDDNSDVSEFFSPGVSETLRKAALRKFFHSPAFNIVDGLDDYDDDFTSFKALGDIVTADMRHRMEVEKDREQEREKEKAEAQRSDEVHGESAESVADDEQGEAVTSDRAEGEHDDSVQSDSSDEFGESNEGGGKEKKKV